MIGYRYPVFVDRDLNRSSILILITFKNPEKFLNIQIDEIKSDIVIVNP